MRAHTRKDLLRCAIAALKRRCSGGSKHGEGYFGSDLHTEVTLGGASLVSSTVHPRRRIAFYSGTWLRASSRQSRTVSPGAAGATPPSTTSVVLGGCGCSPEEIS